MAATDDARAMLPVRQIAYFVEDIRAAALAHHRAFGSGPFFVAEHIALAHSEHRGMVRPLDHSSAYGQWGAVMVEFVQQNDSEPSAYRDVFPPGSPGGLHHVALFVPDLQDAIAGFAGRRWPLAQYAETASGIAFAFVDARAELGHMIELYEPSAPLTGFYEMVAAAAQDWDRSDPLRDLG